MSSSIVLILLFFIIPLEFIFSKESCVKTLYEIKNIQQSYQLTKKCKFTPYSLYKQAEKSYLAEQYYQALSMLKKANVSYLKPSFRHQLLLLKGNILNKVGRYEEAIIAFKQVTSFKGEIKNSVEEKVYLGMIYAYLKKNNDSNDINVVYLKQILRNKFPNSPYLSIISADST